MKSNHMGRLAALLTAVLLLSPGQAAAFSDVSGLAEEQSIAYVTEVGLFNGVSGDCFAPEAPLTRGMTAVVLARLSKSAGAAEGAFADVPPAAYFAPAVLWAAKNGLMDGVLGTDFQPDRAMTRSGLAAVLDGYWAWLGREDAPPVWLTPGEAAVTRGEAAAAFASLSQRLSARDTSVLTHRAADGVTLTGKLDLPAAGPVSRVVLFINGSGPNTYDNKRLLGESTFQYYDLFAQQLTARGVGFFRWNTRGVSAGETPPMYAEVDAAVYQTYVPQTSVSDIGEWIAELRKDARLKDAEVYLLGWSEGTIIAPLAAKAFPEEIDGLLLAGYCNERMDTILDWQQTGGSSMVFYCAYFDSDGDGAISKAELDADPYGVKSLLGAEFEHIDVDKDNAITQEDFRLMLAPSYQALQDAIARRDDGWLAENYGVQLTGAWFAGHAALAPNREVLPQLNLPIAIFHGTIDQNCSVEGAYAIEKAFREAGKTNLSLHVYGGHDHDLNYLLYPSTGSMPQAFEDLFQACRTLQ